MGEKEKTRSRLKWATRNFRPDRARHQLRKLDLKLLTEGLQLHVLHLLLRWQAEEQTRLHLWLAGRRLPRVVAGDRA